MRIFALNIALRWFYHVTLKFEKGKGVIFTQVDGNFDQVPLT